MLSKLLLVRELLREGARGILVLQLLWLETNVLLTVVWPVRRRRLHNSTTMTTVVA